MKKCDYCAKEISYFEQYCDENCQANANKYSWVWKKEGPTGFLNSKYRPLQITEDIAVFSKAKVGSLSKLPIIYHPPGLTEVNIKKQNNPNSTWRENKGYSKGGNVLNSNKEYTLEELKKYNLIRNKNCIVCHILDTL